MKTSKKTHKVVLKVQMRSNLPKARSDAWEEVGLHFYRLLSLFSRRVVTVL